MELLRGLRFPDAVMDQMTAGYRNECIMDDWWRFLLSFFKVKGWLCGKGNAGNLKNAPLEFKYVFYLWKIPF